MSPKRRLSLNHQTQESNAANGIILHNCMLCFFISEHNVLPSNCVMHCGLAASVVCPKERSELTRKENIVELAASMAGPGRWPNKQQHQATSEWRRSMSRSPNPPIASIIILDYTKLCSGKTNETIDVRDATRSMWIYAAGRKLGFAQPKQPQRIGTHQRVALVGAIDSGHSP